MGMSLGLMGLCLATLAGALIALLTRRSDRPSHEVASTGSRVVVSWNQMLRAPPDLLRLCVQRC
jgi:hypothetical protein